MKKNIILSLLLLAFTIVKAQDETKSNDYKQSAGDKGFELEFDPGAIFNSASTSNIFSNGLGIHFKMFTSEYIALRLNANINFTNVTTITQDADDDAGLEELKNKFTSTGIFLSPGIEKHFTVTKRLSPYIGAEATFGYQTSVEKDEYQLVDAVEVEKITNINNFEDGLTIGVAAIAGADFFIAKKLYLGVELSYRLRYFMPFETKYTDSGDSDNDYETKENKPNTLIFEPHAMGVFRIGFLF